MQVVEHFFVADQFLNVESRLFQNTFHHRVRLRVHGRGVQGIGAVRNPQKPRSLFKGLRTQTRHLQQSLAVGKGTIGVAVGDDGFCLRTGETRHTTQQGGGRGIQIHAHGVHAVFHHSIQFASQFRLIHIVLILPHADRLRVNLHQFRQGILQASGNRHRTAVTHVHPGEFGGCRRRSRIHTRPGFAHDHLRKAQFRVTGNQIRRQLIRFAACRAVPDGNQSTAVALRKDRENLDGLIPFSARFVREDDARFEHGSRLRNHRNLHARTDAGVKSDHALVSGGRRKQQIFEVRTEHPDRLFLRFVAKPREEIRFQRC